MPGTALDIVPLVGTVAVTVSPDITPLNVPPVTATFFVPSYCLFVPFTPLIVNAFLVILKLPVTPVLYSTLLYFTFNAYVYVPTFFCFVVLLL